MPGLFQAVTDFRTGADLLRRRRYGVIEAVQGKFHRIVLRPFPKLVSLPEALLLGPWHHGRPGDRCLLYYNEPLRRGGFLAVTYAVSHKGTSFSTIRRVLEALDEIARLKGTDAIVCDVSNRRASRRVLARWGWEPHCPSRWHRNYIKRFYGTYPTSPSWVQPAG